VDPSPSSSSQPLGYGLETVTGWDEQGFPTTMTVSSGWQTMPKSYDQQGFLVTSSPTTTATAAGISTAGACFGADCGLNGKVVGTSTSKAAAAKETSAWRNMAIFGFAAAMAERLLL
jgi:hypothetical protein